MKVGIYIPGLGQSFNQESVIKYAERLKNEISYNKTGVSYELKTEKINYSAGKESNVVSLIEHAGGAASTIYKIYDFKYSDLLTCKFNNYNILIKSASLLWLVIKKMPLLFKRIIIKDNYNRPLQTLYLFAIFLIIAAAILFAIPSVIELITKASPELQKTLGLQGLNTSWLSKTAQLLVPVTTLLLILMPQSRTVTTQLATEFNCLNNYLEFGAQSQEILGNLDLLVEYIAEKDVDCKIHFHCYSCGTILAIDYLFQFGNMPSSNSQRLSEALITIGSPFEFIRAYYPGFYRDRNKLLENNITWINVYSIADALASNFRKDSNIGEAELGLPGFTRLKPINLNYEVAPVKKYSLIHFFSLYNIQVHAKYWDTSIEGQSCIRLVYNELTKQNLFY